MLSVRFEILHVAFIMDKGDGSKLHCLTDVSGLCSALGAAGGLIGQNRDGGKIAFTQWRCTISKLDDGIQRQTIQNN